MANKHPTLCLAKRHPLHPTWNSLPWFCHLEEPGSGKAYALRTSLPGMTSDGGRGKAGTLPGPPRQLARRCSFPRVRTPLSSEVRGTRLISLCSSALLPSLTPRPSPTLAEEAYRNPRHLLPSTPTALHVTLSYLEFSGRHSLTPLW